MRDRSIDVRILLELEDNKVDYGWATDHVLQLCRQNPEAASFLTKAPAHTQHYVALCILGVTLHAHGRTQLCDLSQRIATERRRKLLSEIWQRDFGSPRILQKFGAGVFPRAHYLMFMDCLADPERRAFFADPRVIYHLLVERVAHSNPDQLRRYRSIPLCTFGGETLDLLHQGLCRLRPDIDPADTLARMNVLKSGSGMKRLIESLAKELPMPAPVWSGTESIIPLQRAPDFRAAGLLMRNCLNDLEVWFEALLRDRAFYFCEGEEPAIAALKRHRLFDVWFLHELAGRENKRLSSQRKAQIVEAFQTAGFPYPDLLAVSGLRMPGF